CPDRFKGKLGQERVHRGAANLRDWIISSVGKWWNTFRSDEARSLTKRTRPQFPRISAHRRCCTVHNLDRRHIRASSDRSAFAQEPPAKNPGRRSHKPSLRSNGSSGLRARGFTIRNSL